MHLRYSRAELIILTTPSLDKYIHKLQLLFIYFIKNIQTQYCLLI